MNRKRTIVMLSTLMLTAIAGLMFLPGCASTPTALEGKFYDIVTNVTPVVVTQTNTVFQTNTVERTVLHTNTVDGITQITVQPVRESVVMSDAVVTIQTNLLVNYTYTANTNAAAIAGTASSIANLIAPGSGTLVGAVAAGLWGLWGALRSRKLKKTAGALAQNIEVFSEVTKAMGPTGEKVDRNVKAALQKYQVEAGVIAEVLDILDRTVDKSDAKESADAIRKLVS